MGHGPSVLEYRAHQAVLGDEARLVHEPHRARDARLVIEREAIGALPGLEVEGAADPREELRGRLEGIPLGRPDQSGILEAFTQGGLEPSQRRDVAEPALALLQVGLEQVSGGAVPRAPLRSGLAQAHGEPPAVRPNGLEHARARVLRQGRVAGDRPEVQHRGRGVQAGRGRFRTLNGGAHGLAHV